MKKLLCLLMSVMLIAIFLTPSLCLAITEDPVEPPIDIDEYSLTSSIAASLSISSGTAHVAGRVGSKYADAHCSITVKLQKKASNSSWYTVKSWSNSGTLSTSAGGDYSVSSGSYRTCVLATITHNGDSEHPFKYSGTKTC